MLLLTITGIIVHQPIFSVGLGLFYSDFFRMSLCGKENGKMVPDGVVNEAIRRGYISSNDKQTIST
jgi:hypothetical protein